MAQADPRSIEKRARIWWALWVDPGDRVAGELIERWGAVRAARKVLTLSRQRTRHGQASRTLAEVIGLLRRYPEIPLKRSVDAVVDVCERRGITITTPGDSLWPSSLEDLGPHQPFVLFSRGRLEVVHDASSLLSIVGTRRPSVEGATAARDISAALVEGGATLVSGGALGVDAIAHRAALRAGVATIVVAATSVDRAYPREHSSLFESVSSTGLLVSETPPGKPISPTSFLARNRLIAALSQATIVVECPARSGALSTASHAATLGRALYTVKFPHPSAAQAGNERLIEEWNAEPIHYGQPPAALSTQQLPSASVAV